MRPQTMPPQQWFAHAPMAMQIEIQTRDNITFVTLDGDIDASTAPQVQGQVLPLAKSQSQILMEMSKVPYMSSAGLRMLLSTYRQVTAKEGKLVLVGVSEELLETMALTGFLDFIKTVETCEEGINWLQSDSIKN